jgi:hypothetical protein
MNPNTNVTVKDGLAAACAIIIVDSWLSSGKISHITSYQKALYNWGL